MVYTHNVMAIILRKKPGISTYELPYEPHNILDVTDENYALEFDEHDLAKHDIKVSFSKPYPQAPLNTSLLGQLYATSYPACVIDYEWIWSPNRENSIAHRINEDHYTDILKEGRVCFDSIKCSRR